MSGLKGYILNVLWDPGLNPGAEKGYQWKNWGNSNKINSQFLSFDTGTRDMHDVNFRRDGLNRTRELGLLTLHFNIL